MKHPLLIAAFVMGSVATLPAAELVVGTWYREQEEDTRRVVTTEITFYANGGYAHTIGFRAHDAPSAPPVFREEGTWRREGSVIIITLPSNAPVGVVDRRDRIVKLRIERLSESELSVAQVDAPSIIEYRRRPKQ